MSAIHVADTGVFVAMGLPSNRRYRAVRAHARTNDVTFVLPARVYDELTGDPERRPPTPVDTAISEGWTRVAPPLAYEEPLVSRVVDGVRRYIANADGRPEDEVERADATLAGVAARALTDGTASQAVVYTTDVAAGEGATAVFEREGYGDSFTFVNGFRFIEDLLE